ncbi:MULTISPECIES: MFS transporter [unclassified Streptomyces]|uniref:MFS transporter n=2 Tax=unclassified Streptomyces TaxID=2593676 RepID=UPI001CD70A22|nr:MULTISPECIES: MFS transporter [unclassified Streptomyces]
MKKRYSMGSYLAGAVAARAGDEMSGPALMLAGFALAGSTADASSLLAGVTVSAAAGGPVLGVLLDRARRPGRLVAAALVLYATGLGLILVGLDRLPFAATVLIAVVTGLLGPALSGGWTAQLPRVVPGDRLPRANALDAMTFSAASLAGPALAGVVAEALGAPSAVVVSAALIVSALPAAWLLPARPGRTRDARPGRDGDARPGRTQGARPGRTRDARPGRARDARPGRTQGARPGRTRDARPGRARDARPGRTQGARPGRTWDARAASVIGDLAAGTRVIVGRPPLARATLTSIVTCVAQGMLTACLPLLGERALGGSGRGAVLLSCAAISALVANAVLARFPRSVAPDTVVWAGALVQAAALALCASGRPAVLVVAVLILGAGEGPQLAALFAVRHREAPEHLRGQIFTTGASLKITGFALGAAVAGPAANWSLPGALALAATVAALAVLVFLAVPSAKAASSAGRAGPHS